MAGLILRPRIVPISTPKKPTRSKSRAASAHFLTKASLAAACLSRTCDRQTTSVSSGKRRGCCCAIRAPCSPSPPPSSPSSRSSVPALTAASALPLSTFPGTESYRANAVLREHFGRSAPFAVLLRGPAPAIDRQGPDLVRALRASDPACDHPFSLGPRLGPTSAAGTAAGADRRRLPRRPRRLGQRLGRSARPRNRLRDPATGACDPDRVRDPLAGDPGRVDRRRRAQRADRDPDPAASSSSSSSARRSPPPSPCSSARSRSPPRAGCSISSPPGSTSMPSRSPSAR